MKEEILDFRLFLSVVLVILSLKGQEWSTLNDDKSDTQNLTFIPPHHQQIVRSSLANTDNIKDLSWTTEESEKYITNEKY